MFDDETNQFLALAKSRSKVRESLLGLSKEEKINVYSQILKKYPTISGAISNEELGLFRERDFKKLSRSEELQLRTIYTLSSIGRLFRHSVSGFICLKENQNDEQCGREILLTLRILKKVDSKRVEPFLKSYLIYFERNNCAPVRPKFKATIKALIAKRIRETYKLRSQSDDEQKQWIFRKSGKKPIIMTAEQYAVYVENKQNGLIEVFQWKNEEPIPFEGEGVGFVGKHNKTR